MPWIVLYLIVIILNLIFIMNLKILTSSLFSPGQPVFWETLSFFIVGFLKTNKGHFLLSKVVDILRTQDINKIFVLLLENIFKKIYIYIYIS